MIELTQEQVQALANPEAVPPHIMNPQTKEMFVLLPVKDYERLIEVDYDDSPWTPEEMEALAWRTGTMIGWEEMSELGRKSRQSCARWVAS